ncbi:MAG: methyltransferase [Deltaproteobacteria bacterium]|nr:methyltransferase [Deltaproteobacteria bacterium]
MDLHASLTALSALLARHEALWRTRPFVEDPPRWAAEHPEVAAWCLGLSPAELAALEDGAAPDPSAPATVLGWHDEIHAALPELASPPPPRPLDRRLAWQIPERKQRQVEAFLAALTEPAAGPASNSRRMRILDWCGGKGHLGRTLGATTGLPVTVIERESAYREPALTLATRAGATVHFHAADALATPPEVLSRDTLAVGLHACGELGQRLLAHAAATGAEVALAPCCLHKIGSLGPDTDDAPRRFVPRSALGRSLDPRFDHSALRLATSDEVVARPALRDSRRRENAFRLALDQLLRDASGRDAYTPLGTLPGHLLAGDFAHFAKGAAEHLGLLLPPFDPVAALAVGVHRARRARALGVVRTLFRRAIEVWCALDQAAFLVEHGREVSVQILFPRAISPRNLLVVSLAVHRPA